MICLVISKMRKIYRVVADKKVCVTCEKAGIFRTRFVGLRKLNDFEFAALCIPCFSKALAGIAVVFIPNVIALPVSCELIHPTHEYERWTDVANVSIDMTVCFLFACNALQPNDMFNAQNATEFAFYFIARQMWVPILIDPAAFGEQKRSLAIRLDASTFAYDRCFDFMHTRIVENSF